MSRTLPPPIRRVLVTGAEGYIGRLLVEALAVEALAADPTAPDGARLEIVAADLRLPAAPRGPVAGVTHEALDITDAAAVSACFARHRPEVVVHLAAVVTPKAGEGRALAHRVDVDGTRHVLEAGAAHGLRQLVYTSSGAAYGYHADNPPLLRESDALRGNEAFAYAAHKREVEAMLAAWRLSHPSIGQLIFRVSTILGPRVRNQITAMFERPVVLGLRGVDTPFCFVADEDVVACLARGARDPHLTGIYNLTGAGVLTLREIAQAMGRPFLGVPARWLARGLGLLSARGLAPYGPEQVMFLEHRPVLDPEALRRDLGYRTRSSREVFEVYRRSRASA